MYRFVEHINFISEMYISKISFIIIMVFSCADNLRSHVEFNKCFLHSYMRKYPSHAFYFFSDLLEVLTLSLISYALEVSLYFSAHLVVMLMISNSSYFIASLTCPIISLTPVLTKLVCSQICLLLLIVLGICLIRRKED